MRTTRYLFLFLILSGLYWFGVQKLADVTRTSVKSDYEVTFYAGQGVSFTFQYLDKELTGPVDVNTESSSVYAFKYQNAYLDSNKSEKDTFVRDFKVTPGQVLVLDKSDTTTKVNFVAGRPIEVTAVYPVGSIETLSFLVLVMGILVFIFFMGIYWSTF